ncbi:MAG: hypothetical protein Q8M93_03520 [Polaromonas sp.]|uniref:hypothetical protein n=1 Tax=Polaromonas sp. TaxID=1869339 RepID=UPI002736BEB5|nr:hypothetical protein [Polaromonas sp.]MDP3246015.1 hypothetical protein [Polaromonas sp.]
MNFTIPPPLQYGHEALQMYVEYQANVAALNALQHAATRPCYRDIVACAEALAEHARTEEELMHSPAVPIGQLVRQRLDLRVPTSA